MRIPCPHCGPRSLEEYTFYGDASIARPDPAAPDAEARFVRAVYARDNRAGPHAELWYHGLGCRQWLVALRDTTTHEIASTRPARDLALERDARVSRAPTPPAGARR